MMMFLSVFVGAFPRSLDQSGDDRSAWFATCLMVIQIYTIGSEMWGPQKPLRSNIQIWARLKIISRLYREFLRNETIIVERKTALQAAISSAHACLIW